MPKMDVVRAWKDAEYRASLSEAERASLPENPVGTIEIAESELEHVAGGYEQEDCKTLCGGSCDVFTLGCC
jgi:mersacidin/lichenicidin family type 2 lantibiotic